VSLHTPALGGGVIEAEVDAAHAIVEEDGTQAKADDTAHASVNARLMIGLIVVGK
jgi:hypothetical protein